MTYVRHRSRMIQESVFEDLRDTLIATRWMAGTTARPVNPIGGDPYGLVTTAPDGIFPLAEDNPVRLLDYFPEAKGEVEPGEPVAKNTLAMDNGRPGDPSELELGSNSLEQPYSFNLAFYGVSDAVAEAVMSDLKDRYEGRILRGEVIALYDFVSAPDGPPVVHMEVESFRYSRDVEETSPAEVHLFFAELIINDRVEGR